nr:uncharacterized protein LOC129272810 [Lytechinus pictus]
MSALQEVVQQLENILKTSNEYGPFVCIDAPAPINILQVDTNSNGIQKNTETSSDLLQRESNPLISQGFGLNQQDDHGVIIGQSFGEDLVGSLHRDTGSNLLGENGICHDNIGTTHVEESHEVRVTDHMTIPTCNPDNSNSQNVNGASNESLQEDSVGEVQECGEVTVNNSVPLTHAVNNQVLSNNPLIQTCSEKTVPITKYGLHLDDDNGNEKKDEGEVIVKPLKRKRGRPRKIIDPNSIVPKIKRPRGRPRKYPAPNSDLDHILPIETEYISSKAKHAVPAIVSNELNDHNGVGLSVHFEGEKEGPRTTYDFFSVLGLQNCGRRSIPAVLNQGAPGVQEQIVSEGSIVSLTEEVNYNHGGSIDVPDESFRFHGDVEFICSVSEKEEARTRPAFPEEQCCLRPTEGFATDVTIQNSNESAARVEKREEDEEGEKTNGNKIDQPIKRKRGRPKRPVQNINLKRRLEKVPVTNTSHVGVASASLDVVGLSPLSCTTIIQNFHEHSNVPKGVFTQTTNGDREEDLGYSHGFPVESTCCKVNNNILENEKTEGNKEKCRQEQSGSLSVWEKDTATVQDGTNEGFMEDTVPKLRLRRKMVSETRENQTKSLLNIFKATDGDGNSIKRDAAAGNDYSDSPEEVSHTKVPAVHQDEECPSVMESEVAMDSHPLSDQALTKEILPTNDKAIYEEILPTSVPTDVFPLEDLRDQLNLLPDHPQKMYDTSGMSIKGQTSTKDESDEMVISKDSCETLKKRGRGRPRKIRPINGEAAKDDHDQLNKERVRSNPRKIRPSERVVHDVQKSDDASLDSHPPLYPDDKFHEDENKICDMVSNTTILNDSETEVINNERETSILSKKKLGTDQRVISIVCSSESDEERPKKTAEILPDDDQALTEEILSTSDLALTEDILQTNDQSLNEEMLPSSDQVMAEEIFSTNDQLLTKEILPPTVPTDVLSLGDVNGELNLLPDHPENLQKVCNASEMDIQDQTSVTDESDEMVISKDTCETPMKRGRGRPRKIRPSEEVVQGIEITNVTSLDSNLSILPDDEFHEDEHKHLDMGSNAATILNDPKLYENLSINTLNKMTCCKLSGRDSEAGSNQETEVMRSERKMDSRITNKPEVVQRDVTNVCSSESEEEILKKTADILPPKDQSLNEEMLPINDQQMTEEILPMAVPTDLLPLGDLGGQLNLLPDHPEKPHKVCDTNGIGFREQTSAKDESVDSCKTPTKRGRGRPRKMRLIDKEVTKDDSGLPSEKRVRSRTGKIRPSGEVIHSNEKTNNAFSDSHLSLYHEDIEKNLNLGSNATASLSNSSILDYVSPSTLNEMAHCNLLGSSNQETEKVKNEMDSASRISTKPETVQRVISIVCSSETEVHFSKMIKQRRKQLAFKSHHQRFSTDVPPTDSKALPSFQSKRRSILLQRRCMKKTSVRIKKLPKRLINGSLNLDDQSRLAQLFQCPDEHSQGRTKKCRDVKSQSMSGFTHQMLPAKSTPLSSGGRVIAPHTHGYVQSSISSSPQKTIRLTYGDKNAQSSQVNDEIRKYSHSHKKILKHPPLPFNSVGASVSAKSLIMDRIKKDAAMLQGDFQNKDIQKNSKVGQITARARANISYEKTGRGRPSKKYVSFGTSVKQRIDDYQPRGPLLISKRLFSFKRKSATLNNLKKKERVHVASHKNIPNSVTFGKIRRKVGRPRKNPPTLDIHVSMKNCTSVSEVKRKRGRPRKNPILADTVDPEETSEGAQPCNELKKQTENCSSSQDIQLMAKKEGRQRKQPERLEYKHQEEKPYKSPSSVVSPIKGSEPDSAIQPLAKKRDWPRKYQCEEITPKYPSVPLPITDNYLFGRFGFQPSNIPGCNETPPCDFPLPIEEATVEEIPVLNDALTKSARESIQADIATELDDSVPQLAFFDSEADKDVITEGQWTPDMQQNYPEPPDLSCCIEVFTEAVLPPPPSLNMELDTTSLLNT